jgi:hypothetical protein
MECSVCKQEIKGRYCNSCGQQITDKKVSILGFFKDFFSNIFSLESPILKMIHALLTQPRFIVNNYIVGNKGYYFSPSKLLFYALFVVGIYLSVFPEPKRIFGLNFNVEGISPQLMFVLLLVPILSFFSFITYFKLKRKFVEHLVSISYVLSLWTILLALLEASLRILGWLTIDLELMMLLILLITIFYSNAVVFSKLRKTYIYALNAVLQLIVTVSIFYSLILLLQMLFPKFVHF